VCAPGVAIARPDHEAGATVEIGRGVEITHGVDDVVETAGHGKCSILVRRSDSRRKILQSQDHASAVRQQKVRDAWGLKLRRCALMRATDGT
jgi:hypothetical protein